MGIYFHVRGEIEYKDVYYCECKFCAGHGSGNEIIVRIDRNVYAANESCAVGIVEDAVVSKVGMDDWEWIVGPDVEDVPSDQVMRLIGAPTLL